MSDSLTDLLNSINIPLVALDRDLRIRLLTPPAERVLHLTPADLDRPIGELRLAIGLPDVAALCRNVMETLEGSEREVQDADGRIHLVRIRPHRTAGDRIDGVVIALVDITERKDAEGARYRRLEEKRQRTQEQTRQAQKLEAVGRLAAGIGHDFSNILTALLGYAELLRTELGADHPGRPMLDQIRNGAERLAALNRQLLVFGRQQTANPVVLSPNEVVGDARQVADALLGDRIRFEIVLQPEAGNVRADRAELEQVVLNLVLNARDAIDDAGTITVSTSKVDVDESFSERHPAVPVGRYVAISVKDTGAGMDQETQGRLFEPFFTTKPKGSGVGLGLSTVYAIVRRSEGFIHAYSELGVGSTFTVYLPRVEAAGEPPEAAAQSPATGTHGRAETILLVDDDAPVRGVARRFLELSGYRVLDAASGPEALQISREYSGPIHMMVTDVVMPRMSGRELAFQLASERPDMKVLFISGHSEDEIMHHGVLQKGIALLQKPFTQERLVARVRGLLDAGREK